MSNNLNKIGVVNSVSYQDLVGLLSGITRELGEKSSAFKTRLEENSTNQKSHSYIGTLQNLNTRLGLSVYESFSYSSSKYPYFEHNFGELILTGDSGSVNIPTLTISPDGFWNWKQISQVVAEVNSTPNCSASLIGSDGPSLTLSKQKNSGWVINELITSQTYPLSRGDLFVAGSEILSSTTTGYTINKGVITFNDPPSNISVSYKYLKSPYNVVASEGALMSLTDPSLQDFVIYNNDLIYQVKEAIQDLMNSYASYWAE